MPKLYHQHYYPRYPGPLQVGQEKHSSRYTSRDPSITLQRPAWLASDVTQDHQPFWYTIQNTRIMMTTRTGRSYMCVMVAGSILCTVLFAMYFLFVRGAPDDVTDARDTEWFIKSPDKFKNPPYAAHPKCPPVPKQNTVRPVEVTDRNMALPLSDVTRIFYNRVPKCGSETVIDLFTKLAKKQRFSIYSSNIFRQYHVDLQTQRDLVIQFMNLAQPMIYERHVNFMNFTSFGINTSPVWINVVRDPVQRLASWYYFTRFEERVHYKGNFTDEQKYMSYDQCVSTGEPECNDPANFFILIPFFCGHDPICLVPNQRALDRAKRNLEQYYSVVGLVEDLYTFLEVLEHRIPTMFRGIANSYKEMGNELWGTYKTTHKKSASEETQRLMMLKPGIRLEYEFYYFVKQRFYRQLYAVKKMQLEKMAENVL